MIEIRESSDGQTWHLEGLATTWSSPYSVTDRGGPSGERRSYREEIARGAFASALGGGEVVTLGIQHSHDAAPLASTRGGSLSFGDSDAGLVLRAVLPKNESDVADAVSKARRGVLSGMSVGMAVLRDDWSDGGTRRVIRDARLFEVSLVSEAANPEAAVTSVRTAVGELEVRRVGDLTVVEARAGKYAAHELAQLGSKGQAHNHGDGHWSHPTADREDLEASIKAASATGTNAVRKYLIGRAREMGLPRLIPSDWNADGSVNGARSGLTLAEEYRLSDLNELEYERLGLAERGTRYRAGRPRRPPTERDRHEAGWKPTRRPPTDQLVDGAIERSRRAEAEFEKLANRGKRR